MLKRLKAWKNTNSEQSKGGLSGMEWVIGRRVWLLQIEWISRVNEKVSFGKNRESQGNQP